MGLTKAQKYNNMLDKIITPEVKRLEKIEKISNEILEGINKIANIDTCGLDKCHIINTITRIIDKNKNNLLEGSF